MPVLIPLLSLLFQPAASTSGSGYGAPSVGYGAPEESYGAPAPAYGAPGYSRSVSTISINLLRSVLDLGSTWGLGLG